MGNSGGLGNGERNHCGQNKLHARSLGWRGASASTMGSEARPSRLWHRLGPAGRRCSPWEARIESEVRTSKSVCRLCRTVFDATDSLTVAASMSVGMSRGTSGRPGFHSYSRRRAGAAALRASTHGQASGTLENSWTAHSRRSGSEENSCEVSPGPAALLGLVLCVLRRRPRSHGSLRGTTAPRQRAAISFKNTTRNAPFDSIHRNGRFACHPNNSLSIRPARRPAPTARVPGGANAAGLRGRLRFQIRL